MEPNERLRLRLCAAIDTTLVVVNRGSIPIAIGKIMDILDDVRAEERAYAYKMGRADGYDECAGEKNVNSLGQQTDII